MADWQARPAESRPKPCLPFLSYSRKEEIAIGKLEGAKMKLKSSTFILQKISLKWSLKVIQINKIISLKMAALAGQCCQ